MNPILSISIPTFNRASFLQEALDSVLLQHQEGVEIVISDNGSTDNTQEIIKHYADKHPFIRVCGFKENKGIDQNIVNVVKHAQGEYVQLFSDDDLFTKDLLKTILDEVVKTSPMAICLNHFSFKQRPQSSKPFLPNKRLSFENGRKFFSFCGLGFISSLIFKRKEALEYIDTVKMGKECAHLDIVTRLVLQKQGPFIYLGTGLIAGRAPEIPRYNMINSCIVFQKQLYSELFVQKLICNALYHTLLRKLIFSDLPRIIYRMYRNKIYDAEYIKPLMIEFNKHPIYKSAIVIYFYMNKRIVLFSGSFIKSIISRKKLFKRRGI